MHIFFVTNNYKPYAGGVVGSIDTFAEQLRAYGHRVTIVTLDFIVEQTQEPDVVRLYCPITFRYKHNYMAIPWRTRRQLEELIQKYKPDIVHVHHPFLLGAVAVRLARKYTIPTVFTYHTMYERYAHYVPLLPEGITRFVVTKLIRSFYAYVDAIIAPSLLIQQSIQVLPTSSKMYQIASPIHDIFFSALCRPRVLYSDTVHLVTVSRFAHEKNINALLDLMKLLDDRFTLTLVGYGWEYKQLKDYAYTTLKLSASRIQFIYKPTQEELLSQYNKADLFVYASQTDTQALVLAEAMASGLPVIALTGPGQADIVKNNYNGYMVASIGEMKLMLETVGINNALYRALSDNAYTTAQNYTQYHLTTKLLSCYKDLLVRSP